MSLNIPNIILPAPPDVAFNIWGFDVYWYGITMAVAILIAFISANNLFNSQHTYMRKDIVFEYAPIIIIMGILGARLYYCALSYDYYAANPMEILDIREGGLSIHGAIIGGILSIILMSKHYKVPLFKLLDPMACATILGQAIGRWGNYFNSEAYGVPVLSQKWGVYIPQAKRVSEYSGFNLFHPTFLYESIADLIAFFILLHVMRNFAQKRYGFTFFLYLVIYSVIRYFIENLRVDSALDVGGFHFAGIISIVLFVVGIIGLICVRKEKLFKED